MIYTIIGGIIGMTLTAIIGGIFGMKLAAIFSEAKRQGNFESVFLIMGCTFACTSIIFALGVTPNTSIVFALGVTVLSSGTHIIGGIIGMTLTAIIGGIFGMTLAAIFSEAKRQGNFKSVFLIMGCTFACTSIVCALGVTALSGGTHIIQKLF